MKSKKIFAIISVLVLGAGIIMIAPQAHAQTPTPVKTNFFQGLIDVIAQKFGLDKTKVQSVVDDYAKQERVKRQQMMQQREETRLNQLVQEGKITSAQKDAILKELAALKNKYNQADLKNMTPDQRRQQFQNMQNELKSWAQSQGIDLSILKPGFGMGKRDMGWHGMWRGTSLPPAQ